MLLTVPHQLFGDNVKHGIAVFDDTVKLLVNTLGYNRRRIFAIDVVKLFIGCGTQFLLGTIYAWRICTLWYCP